MTITFTNEMNVPFLKALEIPAIRMATKRETKILFCKNEVDQMLFDYLSTGEISMEEFDSVEKSPLYVRLPSSITDVISSLPDKINKYLIRERRNFHPRKILQEEAVVKDLLQIGNYADKCSLIIIKYDGEKGKKIVILTQFHGLSLMVTLTNENVLTVFQSVIILRIILEVISQATYKELLEDLGDSSGGFVDNVREEIQRSMGSKVRPS